MKDRGGVDCTGTAPSVASDIFALSDDECVGRLAKVVKARNSDHLDEAARLIGRLMVTIE